MWAALGRFNQAAHHFSNAASFIPGGVAVLARQSRIWQAASHSQ